MKLEPGDVFTAKIVIREVHMDLEAAREMIAKYGYLEALRLSERMRDESSAGTCSHSLWNATVKQIKLAATIGPLER